MIFAKVKGENNIRDKFTKVILTSILICLIIITFKLNNKSIVTSTPDVNINNMQQYIQIAPNRIGIVDSGSHTGNKGQLIIFDFDSTSKSFRYVGTLKSPYILSHPEEYGIPIKSK